MFVNSNMLKVQAVNEIVKCNDITGEYGLTLTAEQAAELVETRTQALNASGRIEFGGGIIEKIIKEFCDSPYLIMSNYAESLHDLVELFYFYKNETMDMVGDDELISFMKEAFDGICQGSMDLLSGKELYKIARNIRFGKDPYSSEDEAEEDEEDDEYGEY